MASERVEIHPSHLPTRVTGDRRPCVRVEIERREHLEGNPRNPARTPGLERLEVLHDSRKCLVDDSAPDKISVERLARSRLRLRVDHLQHVDERRALPNRRREDLAVVARCKPLAHESLRCRPERLTPDDTRANDLNERSEHLAVVDDPGKDLCQSVAVANGEDGAQQGRHVLHVSPLSTEDGRLGDELGVDVGAQLENLRKLLIRGRVERPAQAAGRRVLGERVLGRELVSRRSVVVASRGLREQLPRDRLEECLVGHRFRLPCRATSLRRPAGACRAFGVPGAPVVGRDDQSTFRDSCLADWSHRGHLPVLEDLLYFPRDI